MRKIIFLAAAGALCTMQLGLTGCTDMDGDGIDNVEWGGSTNPESTSYRNPVWEPSLEGGTVIVTPNNFVAIGGETQWAVGVDYCCPTILSTNMMQWTTNQQVAFSAANRPAWITGRINSLSADLITETTKVTITTTTTETDEETGQETTTTTSKEEDRSASRYIMVYSTAKDNDIYIGYTTDNGSYVRKIEFPFTVDATSYAMTINISGLPVLGDATKVSSASFSNIALFRDADGNYMIFGDVDGGVNYAVASDPTGPYTAGSGSLLSSNGDTFIEGGNGYENPCNVMRIIPSSNGNCYVAFNATLTETPAMPSGYAREPMMVNPFKISGGKVSAAIKVNSGWTSPRFVR